MFLDACYTAALADFGELGWAAPVERAPLASYLAWAWGLSPDEAEGLACHVEVGVAILILRREWALLQDLCVSVLLFIHGADDFPAPFTGARATLDRWV